MVTTVTNLQLRIPFPYVFKAAALNFGRKQSYSALEAQKLQRSQ
jgi:hypothetical protein